MALSKHKFKLQIVEALGLEEFTLDSDKKGNVTVTVGDKKLVFPFQNYVILGNSKEVISKEVAAFLKQKKVVKNDKDQGNKES